MYRMTHNKQWPANLETLRREGCCDPNDPPFWCVFSDRPEDPNTTPPDYFYLPPTKPHPDPNTLILCELPNHHPWQGRAAAFVGDRAEFLTHRQLEVELKKPQNARFAIAYRQAFKNRQSH